MGVWGQPSGIAGRLGAACKGRCLALLRQGNEATGERVGELQPSFFARACLERQKSRKQGGGLEVIGMGDRLGELWGFFDFPDIPALLAIEKVSFAHGCGERGSSLLRHGLTAPCPFPPCKSACIMQEQMLN